MRRHKFWRYNSFSKLYFYFLFELLNRELRVKAPNYSSFIQNISIIKHIWRKRILRILWNKLNLMRIWMIGLMMLLVQKRLYGTFCTFCSSAAAVESRFSDVTLYTSTKILLTRISNKIVSPKRILPLRQ